MTRDEEFAAFVLARSGRLLHLARMLCGDAALAEDLVQSTLEKAYLRWDRIEMGDPFGYVRQALVNHHLSWLRRRHWRERASGQAAELERLPELAAGRPDSTGTVEWRMELAAALGTLTRRERTVVVLRYLEDLSEAETAAALGVAVGTVKSATSRALAKLRAIPELQDGWVGEQA